MNAHQFLTRLHEERQKDVEFLKRNPGVRKILTDLYPDEAHFIYELLQNAEDARATSISFELSESELIVTHNGRAFDQADVESITRIGESTKRDDINKIGKFGVGFKAVFAYTNTPRIISDGFTFEIHDLVCPVPLPHAYKPETTRFEFPFNHPQKDAAHAYRETADGLKKLSAETLLFLRSIREISWFIEEEASYGRVERTNESDNHIIIRREATDRAAPEVSEWLRFQSTVEANEKLTVAVAFRLEERRQGKDAEKGATKESTSALQRIIPIEGKLFIFFPADKEATRLCLHIHGPYASTVARDSIAHGRSDNQELLDGTAELLASVLPQLRDSGYLTTDFLAVLPNDDDNLAPFYKPLQHRVVKAMKTNPLVPAHEGGHAPATCLLQGPRAIKDVISDDLLPFFVGGADKRWAAGAMDNRRESLFLESLGIKNWSWDELQSAIFPRLTYSLSEKEAQWFAARTDEWMHRFYAMLEAGLSRGMSIYLLQPCPIVRLTSGIHVRGEDAYFPSRDGEDNDLQGLPRVSSAVLQGKNKERVERVRSFLARLDVKTAGEREEIIALLNQFYREGTPNPAKGEHLSHLRRFVSWWKDEQDTELFDQCFLFRDESGEEFVQADGLYLDVPIHETGLSSVFRGDPKTAERVGLWSGYSNAKIPQLVEFAKAVGVLDRLEVKRQHIPSSHPDYQYLYLCPGSVTAYEINDDYTIEGLDGLLSRGDVNVARCIWNAVVAAQEHVLYARYRPNRSYGFRQRPSTLAYKLAAASWLPDMNGVFHKPADIALDQLPPNFPRSGSQALIRMISLGTTIQKQQEQYQQRKAAAETLGIPLELLSKLADLGDEEKKRALAGIGDWLQSLKDHNFPERSSTDPSRRSAKVAASALDATEVEYEGRRRSVRTSNRESKLAARQYLVDLYTNDDEELYCQVCEEEMPFKLLNGEYYFEAVEFLDLDREHRENYLALCPTCAAKFKHANATSDDELRESTLEVEGDEVPVSLAYEDWTIRFVETHLIDLRAVLGATAEV